MKNNKKLVVLAGAAALGLVAATGVTSGFAWFAVNNQVTATSLTIKAKSNGAYLLIDTTDNAAANAKGTSALTKDVQPAQAPEVYPCAYTTAAITWDKGTQDTSDDYTVQANNWYTGTINNKEHATIVENTTDAWTSLTTITLGQANYFAKYDFYLTLATGSEDYSGTMGIAATFNTGSDAAVKAAVVFGSQDQVILDGTTGTHDYATQSLTSTTSIHVAIYLYIDGTSTNVYTDYASPITGDVDFAFRLGANA